MTKADPNGQDGLVAAYREGLGLGSVTVIWSEDGVRVACDGAGDGAIEPTPAAQARWWCRRKSDAERVAAAAMARLRRQDGSCEHEESSVATVLADESIMRAAKRLGVILYSDTDIITEAMAVVARVDCGIERLRQSGELRSVNKDYRKYRIETSARGGRAMRYADWMRRYRENLVRKLAATLRYL